MDHLPIAAHASHIPVPYISTEPYDGQGFSSYPQRKGWNKNDVIGLNFHGKSQAETAAFLQSWLFFGLLFEFLDMSLETHQFIAPNDQGEPFITTARLPEYLQQWESRENAIDHVLKLESSNRTKLILDEAADFALALCSLAYREDNPNKNPPYWPLSPELALAILCLISSFSKARYCVYAQILDPEQQFRYDTGVSELLVSLATESGWCPKDVSILRAKPVDIFYYCVTMGPPKEGSHGRCSSRLCALDQLDESKYKTAHVDPNCSCGFIEASQDKIEKCLDDGDIPLVKVISDETGLPVELDVVSRNPGSEYIAFSHVWCDGFGNVRVNALPKCVLKALELSVDLLCFGRKYPGKTMPFWIDTLCVPRDREHRKLAIVRMASTYKAATAVIVIDWYMTTISYKSDHLEIFARLVMCRWMRRLWKYQEQMLANEIWLLFADGIRPLNGIFNKSRREFQQTGHQLCSWILDEEVPCLSIRFDRIPTVQARFRRIWHGIFFRTTSHAGDEAICIATMLGLDVVQILNIPEELLHRRMAKLLSLVGNVPGDLLFQDSEKMNLAGHLWAPTTFLATPTEMPEVICPVGSRHVFEIDSGGRGLKVRLPGFILKLDIKSTFPYINWGCPFYLVVQQQIPLWYTVAPFPRWERCHDIGPEKAERIGLILPNELETYAGSWTRGVIVLIEEIDADGNFFVMFKSVVQIDYFDKKSEILRVQELGLAIEPRQVLSGDQTWYIR